MFLKSYVDIVVVTAGIADVVVIFTDEDLQILLSATLPKAKSNISSLSDYLLSLASAREVTYLKRPLEICSRPAKRLFA